MALTRKMLEALQIPESAIQTIIDEHTSTTSKINEELKTANATLADVQKELEGYKSGDWEKKYNAEHDALEALKSDIAAKETKSKKTAALSKYFEGKGIKDGSLKIALRGTDLAKIELDDKGEIKDTAELDALVAGDFAPLVTSDDDKSGAQRVIDSAAGLDANSKQVYSDQLRAAFGLKTTENKS